MMRDDPMKMRRGGIGDIPMTTEGRLELSKIAAELLMLRRRAEAVGSRRTSFMIVAAARQAETDAGTGRRAEQEFEELLAEREEYLARPRY